MPTPTKQDIQKKRDNLNALLKQLTGDGRLPEKKLVSMLRSAIRQVWMRAPNKLAKLELARIPDLDPNTKTKWLFKCEMCNNLFKGADVEVDHKHGNHSFTKLSDFENFCDKILNASLDDLQILCKDLCHATKTYSERYGISFDDALKEKEVIAFLKNSAVKQKEILTKMGVPKSELTNEDKRKEVYRKLMGDLDDSIISKA